MPTKKAVDWSAIAPAAFEGAEFTAPGRADEMLRWLVNEGAALETTGTVEDPFGFVALLNICGATIAAYANGQGDPWVTERRNFTPGWYLVQITNLGLVYGYAYANETEARVDLIDLQRFAERFEALSSPECEA